MGDGEVTVSGPVSKGFMEEEELELRLRIDGTSACWVGAQANPHMNE